MAKRKGVSASLRWSVFARDGFCCRYCGRQAGQDCVELHADHVVSVADGGDNSFDNLVTACQRCNGGKSARSLSEIPAQEDVIRRVQEMRGRMSDLVDDLRSAQVARKALEQEVINLKCDAYSVEQVDFDKGEMASAIGLLNEFGADLVVQWYRTAAKNRVTAYKAIRYVCGCARNHRERAANESEAQE